MEDFQDWDLLHESDDSGVINFSDSEGNTRVFGENEDESEGTIRADYFSIESKNKYGRTEYVCEEGFVESDHTSFIEPELDNRYPMKVSGTLWPDSSSERSDNRMFSEFDAKNEFDVVESEKSVVALEGFGKVEAGNGNPEKFWSDSGGAGSVHMEFGDLEKQTKLGDGDNANSRHGSELSGEEKEVDGSVQGIDKSTETENAAIEAVKSESEAEKKAVALWKLPLELLKYCVFRVSPVWTVSVAAAVMGFLILGRRFYKMRRRTRNLHLNATVDDKKVSQFVNRAAHLNEAFSVVKRVPVVRRPILPAGGVMPWPVMSLR